MGHHVHLADAIKNVPDLKNEYETNPVSKKVIDFGARLYSCIKSNGDKSSFVKLSAQTFTLWDATEIEVDTLSAGAIKKSAQSDTSPIALMNGE